MISVAIVDDKRDIREGLKLIIDAAEGFQCQHVYGDAHSAIKGIVDTKPDVVLMDVELPEMNGIECTKKLKSALPQLNIIMLTVHADDDYIFQALRAGAYGYLTKNIFPSKLLNAIKDVNNGGSPMSSYIARRVVSSFNRHKRSEVGLSSREKEVLHHLCQGDNYRTIAEKLFVSPNTVRFHLKNIYKKLQVNSKYEAVIKATKEGMV